MLALTIFIVKDALRCVFLRNRSVTTNFPHVGCWLRAIRRRLSSNAPLRLFDLAEAFVRSIVVILSQDGHFCTSPSPLPFQDESGSQFLLCAAEKCAEGASHNANQQDDDRNQDRGDCSGCVRVARGEPGQPEGESVFAKAQGNV